MIFVLFMVVVHFYCIHIIIELWRKIMTVLKWDLHILNNNYHKGDVEKLFMM